MANHNRKMLLVLAHPDDETFGMGGTIARYVAEGVEVSLICTTNGDVGSADAQFMKGFNSVAEMRLAELKCATDLLGMKEVITLGYRDSGMPASPDNNHPDSLVSANFEELVSRVTHIIRRLRPDVLVTFDPYGGYGHPDHLVTHKATLVAFEAAANPEMYPGQLIEGLTAYRVPKVYFTTFDKSVLRLMIRLMPLFGVNPRKWGRNKDIDAVVIAEQHFPIHARIDIGKYQQLLDEARRCHASQLGGVGPRRLSQMIMSLVFGVQDHYMRFYPPVSGRLRERDLFQ